MGGLPRSPAIVSPAPAGRDPARRVLRSTASGSTLGVWWRLAFGDSLLPVAETSISTTHDQATWFRAYDLSVSRRQTLSFDWDSVSRYYSAMSTPVPAPTHPVTALRRLVGTFPSVLLGYSGGVDSAFLAGVCGRPERRRAFAARGGRDDQGPDPGRFPRSRAADLGCAGGAMSLESRRLRPDHHAGAPASGGSRGALSPRAGGDGRPARAPSRRGRGAHRGRAAVDPVARAAPRSRDRPARGSRVRGGRRGSAGLSPGQPARGRQSGLRVFLALNLPEATRQALWRATAPLRDAGFPIRWVRPEGIHLTLKFLGEVAEQRDPELAAALTRTVRGARALPLALGGF